MLTQVRSMIEEFITNIAFELSFSFVNYSMTTQTIWMIEGFATSFAFERLIHVINRFLCRRIY